jgi:hypothetical protein
VQQDATHWMINSSNGFYHETITIAPGSVIDPAFDVLFV